MDRRVDIGGRAFNPDDVEGQAALQIAHRERSQVTCLCKSPGVPVYVALIDGRYFVKRFPETGSQHSSDCVAFEPPEHLSGRAALSGTGILEQPGDDGGVLLKVDFPLSRSGPRAAPPPGGPGVASEAVSASKKVGLTALLHYLWDEAELTKWVPAMEGKRWWGSVSAALDRALQGKQVKGRPLCDVVFVPEPYRKEVQAEINARRTARLERIFAQGGASAPVGLVIGEYVGLEETRLGARVVIRHSPRQFLFADSAMVARITRVFAPLIEMADMVEGSRAIAIARVTRAAAGYCVVEQMGMMVVNDNWLPFENLKGQDLLARLCSAKRRFSVQMRYNLAPQEIIATAVLTDMKEPTALFVLHPNAGDEEDARARQVVAETEYATWFWGSAGVMPDLPRRDG